MTKILIVYASHFGQTRKIAVTLAEHLRELGARVDLFDARYPDHVPSPEGYDTVVLGSRIEIGRHAPDLLRYIREHRDVLETIPTAFFSVSMAASSPKAGPDPSGYMTQSFEDLEWHPTCARSLAGGLPYRKYGWLMRCIMKRISKSAGHTTDTSRNHELTDWAEVRALAEEIAALPHQTTASHAV